jgi:hypothetical protein
MHRDPSSTTQPPALASSPRHWPTRRCNLNRHDIPVIPKSMRSRDLLTMTFMHGNAARISQSQIGGRLCLHGWRPNDTDAVFLSRSSRQVFCLIWAQFRLWRGRTWEMNTGREGMKADSLILLRGICLSLWVLLVISCKLPANRLYVFCAWTAAAFFMRFRR